MNEIFNFKLKKNLDFELNCKKGLITAIYPIILILMALVGTVIYPFLLIKWFWVYSAEQHSQRRLNK